MPYNEFVEYRFKTKPLDKQILIVCDKEENSKISVPKDLEVYFVGNDVFKIRRLIVNLLKRFKCDNDQFIIHQHQPKSALIFNIATLCLRIRKKTIFTVHSLFPAYNFFNKVMSFSNTLLAKKVSFVSTHAYNKYPSIIRAIKGPNLCIIKNGVDIKRIENAAEAVSFNNKLRLIYVARMIPLKNHKFILNIISKLEKYELVLIGEKNQEVLEYIKFLGIEKRVILLGSMTREEVFEELKKSDIYVSPSKIEGLPVSVLEAMGAKLPVLISDIEPHKEISKGRESILLAEFSEKDWINQIKYLEKLGSEKRKEYGERNYEIASKEFSLDHMLKKYDDLYFEI